MSRERPAESLFSDAPAAAPATLVGTSSSAVSCLSSDGQLQLRSPPEQVTASNLPTRDISGRSPSLYNLLESCSPNRSTLSLLELILESCAPVLNNLLAHLPTSSILALYQTSSSLRANLRHYPLAWRTLSFRVPQPALLLTLPGNETPDGRRWQTTSNTLGTLLVHIAVPFGTRLTNLDVCNTSISGLLLVSYVLLPRLDTIQHLSVRGCKNVSIKYHLLDFLENMLILKGMKKSPVQFALKSLYTYRCRHHRRRPYFPASLIRRESDSEPTHKLIDVCHRLGIWTDTAWCPTPGGRCFRRKDYHTGRVGPRNTEVWVPFDKLWRSGNRIGPTEDTTSGAYDGCLWEARECGYNGEALGTGGGLFSGEGKEVPAHLRRSHRTFLENIKCDQCGDAIPERCEQCSVRMHCSGCRKTFCASCAFDRPITRRLKDTSNFTTLAFGNSGSGPSSQLPFTSYASDPQAASKDDPSPDKFWWAPGATRSPNRMTSAHDDGSDSDNDDANPPAAGETRSSPKLNMSWCCLEPIFSGGGGIAFLGPGLNGKGADRIRAAPLPRKKGFEDPDFLPLTDTYHEVNSAKRVKNQLRFEEVLGGDLDIFHYLMQDNIDLLATSCPRNLCQGCFRSFKWKVSCRKCSIPLCKEHDFRALKVRKCGFRDLTIERDFIRNQSLLTKVPFPGLKIPARQSAVKPGQSRPDAQDDIQNTQSPTTSGSANQVKPATKTLENPALSRNTADSFGLFLPKLAEGTATSSARPTRQRAASLSSTQTRPLSLCQSLGIATHPPSQRPLPVVGMPLHPVGWQGCGAYYCQQYRPVGDLRPRCPAEMRECADCGVYVCEFCIKLEPPCGCSYCSGAYHCPCCAEKPRVRSRCRAEDEKKVRLVAEREEQERKNRLELWQKQADVVAESVGEFFARMMEYGVEENMAA